ncbi:hypothetical protein PVAND_013724 [Polypedilum vanderplanki]|uniref:Uncharacterized protein n=1 Tax=Polypedilum vanderplanki TaxID=319348 RepID=A0A9J6CS78_POLVA|nr:hypothetical protein PVAND_013724 [Polypedilum vanderplanki]
MSANGIDLSQQNSVVDDVTNATTKTSNVQSSIDESNLNAISFNSATSSSPAVVTTSAIYTTSSITTSNNNIHNNNNNFSNNNSILSRKNSLTMQSQQLINGSSFSTNMSAKASYTNSGKVESVPDLLNASSLNNPHLLSAAVFYNQPYQQLALAAAPSLYSDPAQFAKEMAQKNYANALKFAAVAQSQAGKTPSANSLTYSNPYSGVALSAASTFQRHVNLSNAAANPYIAAAAHQQFLNQQNFLYSGLTSPIASPQFTGVVTSNASSHPTPTSFASSVTASYPFGGSIISGCSRSWFTNIDDENATNHVSIITDWKY